MPILQPFSLEKTEICYPFRSLIWDAFDHPKNFEFERDSGSIAGVLYVKFHITQRYFRLRVPTANYLWGP